MKSFCCSRRLRFPCFDEEPTKRDYPPILGASVVLFALAGVLTDSFSSIGPTRRSSPTGRASPGRRDESPLAFTLVVAVAVILSPFRIIGIVVDLGGRRFALGRVMTDFLLRASTASLVGPHALLRLPRFVVPVRKIQRFRWILRGSRPCVRMRLGRAHDHHP